MQPKITGHTLPVLEIGLDAGEMIIAPPGELAWMTPNIRMNTTTATAGVSGLWGAITRAVSGGGLFMTEFTADGMGGGVAFAPKMPGHIVPVDVRPGQGFMVHRDGFLCGTHGVELSTSLQRSLGAGIFGGEGFILQHIAGAGQGWVALGGEIIQHDLQPGEVLLVHPGHVGMFEDSVQFQITMISGVKNALFGGDGLFLVQLTGPGKIWLQTMTVPHLAHAIERYLPKTEGAVSSGQSTESSVAGAMLKGIFGNTE